MGDAQTFAHCRGEGLGFDGIDVDTFDRDRLGFYRHHGVTAGAQFALDQFGIFADQGFFTCVTINRQVVFKAGRRH